MRILIVSIIFAASFSAHAGELVVLARLNAIETGVAFCGVLKTGTVAEYKILRVISGGYTKHQIYVVHTCIEMQKPKLSVGQSYILSLAKDNVDRIEIFSKNRIPNGFTAYFLRAIESK